MLSRLIKKIVDNNLAGLDDKKFRFSFSQKTDYYEKDININDCSHRVCIMLLATNYKKI